MALGHDIGHTPFGHIGEELLARFLPRVSATTSRACGSSEKLEKNGAGLNLTKQTRDGILKHSSPTEGGLETAAWGEPETPEGWVVRYADKVAYLHHDIDDAMRAEIITEADYPRASASASGQRSRASAWTR
jgi:dGTPase